MKTPEAGQPCSIPIEQDAPPNARFTRATIGVCEASRDGRILRVNQGFCRMTGRTEAMLRSVRLNDLLDEAAVQELLDRPLLVSSGDSISWTHRHVSASGTVTHARCTLTPIDEETLLVISVPDDDSPPWPNDSARFRAGDKAHAHAGFLLESVTDAAFAFDREWRYTYVNAAAEQFLKTERAKLLGRVCWDVFPQRRDDANARGVLQTMAERRSVFWESQSSMSGRWCQWRSYPMPDGGAAVIMQSIDERVRAEQGLRASEQRFQALADLVPALIWMTDRDGEPRWLNRRWLTYTGRTSVTVPFADVATIIHPDDREATVQRRTAAIATGQPVRLEHRLRRADNVYRWHLAQLQPIVDSRGDVIQWVGAATDIQEHRDALAAERETRAEAEQTLEHVRRVFAQLPLVLAVFRGPDHAVEVTTELTKQLYPRLIEGQKAREAFSELAHYHRGVEILDQVYRNGVSAHMQQIRSSPSASSAAIYDVKCHALKRPTGEVYGVVAIGFDVTALVSARAEAESQREELARILAQAPFAVSVVMGPDHILRSANEMQRKFIGYRPALNVPLRTAFPDSGMQGVHAMLDRVFSSGETMVVREQAIAWDRQGTGVSELGHFDVIYQPIRAPDGAIEGVLSFTVDVSASVTARHAVAEARDEAERAREHFRSIVGTIPTAIAVTRGERLIYELANPAYVALVGERELVGRAMTEVFPELDDGALDVMHEVLRTGRATRRPEDRVVYDREGNGVFYEGFFNTFLAPLRAPDGEIEGVVLSTLEVTEQVHQRDRIEAVRREAELARTELERAQTQLESRIRERTQELASANAALAAEIEASAKAEATRRILLRRLASAREDEQRRTARDLHDQFGQTLSALMLAIKAACDAQPLSPTSATLLGDALRLAEDLGRDVHELATRLRPALLDDMGLQAALRQLLNDWSRRSSVQVDYQATWLESERLPPEVETVLFRVVQEAMTNVARHARAHRVSVVVERHDGHAIAVVEDDGVGFDHGVSVAGRLGLMGMRERVMLAGGWLDVESEPGRGTTVIARVPLGSIGLEEQTAAQARRSDDPES